MIELTVGKYLINQVLHKSLNSGGCGVFEGSRCRFHHVGQHDQPCLFGLWFGAGVAVVVYFNGIGAFQMFRLLKKIADEASAVVLLYGVDDRLSQLVLPRYIHTVFDMCYQNQAGHRGGQFVVPVHPVGLVFYKIKWFFYFSDIMIISTNFSQ